MVSLSLIALAIQLFCLFVGDGDSGDDSNSIIRSLEYCNVIEFCGFIICIILMELSDGGYCNSTAIRLVLPFVHSFITLFKYSGNVPVSIYLIHDSY
jgi:hypothetical protein